MTARAQSLLRAALELPTSERADLANELLTSLKPSSPEPQVSTAWELEIERRAQRVVSGASVGEPWETVKTRAARRLAAR
jgi:putative addiction module component (TIGR02574 family)